MGKNLDSRVSFDCQRDHKIGHRNHMIELFDASKTYMQGRRTVNAVRGVSLTVRTGEYVTIMGPSGSGKSTLMHLMGALDTPTGGRAVFHGQDLQSMSDRQRSLLRRDRIGFVFQAFNLLPTLTAAENVALPLLLGQHEPADCPRTRGRVPRTRKPRAIARSTSRTRCPAARCSASRSPGHSWPTPKRCCATSRPATSTPPPAARS